MKKSTIDLAALNAHLDAVADALKADKAVSRAVNVAVDSLGKFDVILSSPRCAGVEKHLGNLRAAITKDRGEKALVHLERIRKITRLRSNDTPFTPDDRVWVERWEHGWHVGYGVVRDATLGSDGIWTYTVVLEETNSSIHIDHTRDLRSA